MSNDTEMRKRSALGLEFLRKSLEAMTSLPRILIVDDYFEDRFLLHIGWN